METPDQLGTAENYTCVKVTRETVSEEKSYVATEIPFTIVTNGVELVTFMCSPAGLRELTCGFLYTSGFISDIQEVNSFQLDSTQWTADVWLKNVPDEEQLHKRLYTSGCGRGVMYSSISDLPSKVPLDSGPEIKRGQLQEMMGWFQKCSPLHGETHGVHSAAVSVLGTLPSICYDDVGRHNAVDKVVGRMMMEQIPFSKSLLLTSGRISSEIVAKAAACGLPIIVSLSAPTHQAILSAQVMNLTLVCFARAGRFSIFTGKDRIVFDD